jgi:hypothetical protein
MKKASKYHLIARAVAGHCSGGGFDCAWSFFDKGRYVKAQTDWHLLGNEGYYLGYYGFTVIIPKNKPLCFKLYGLGHNKRILERHDVLSYIDDSLFWALKEIVKEGAA